ncbi:MAG: type 1 glutamine amidotransferase [Desulfuromonadaceae bacterium]|nr:type 1 glutamine amidotransferase [Desulfuromonadaceae bacterium]
MLHIIQNDPDVPPGNILHDCTIPYSVHHPYRGERLPEVGEISALIVMGGAMGANDDSRHPFLADLKSLIRTVVTDKIPYLGICLGGQLLAAALGGSVVSRRWEELGFLSVSLTRDGAADPLFDGISTEFTTFQWHHDSFDIPAGGVLLATSPDCPHQAFRFGDSAWGLQFHPEVTGQIIREWCGWDAATRLKADELVCMFEKHSDNYCTISRHLMGNFLLKAGMSSLS